VSAFHLPHEGEKTKGGFAFSESFIKGWELYMIKFTKKYNDKLNETIYEGTNEFGLRVIVMPKKFTKSYAIIGTKYGSIDSSFNGIDVPDGIAHFLEHKLFEQPDGGNAFDEFSKMGANSNAFTSFNETAYLFSSTDNYDENLRILLNFVYSPYFTDENVAKEQGIIGQEIKMYDDEPSWRAFFNMLGLLFKNHPVRKDIAGTIETISKITPQTLNVCYSTFYHPSNMVLVCVGDVTPERVEKVVSEELKKANVSKSYRDIERSFPSEPIGLAGKEILQKMGVGISLFMIGFKDRVSEISPEELQKERAISEIAVDSVFGKTSEIYESLYDSGLINESFSFEFSGSLGYSYVCLGGEANRPKEIFDEIKARISAGLTVAKEDMERVKKGKIGEFYREFNDSERLGHVMVLDSLAGINTMDYVGTLENVTFEEVQARVKQLFDEKKMVLSIVENIDE